MFLAMLAISQWVALGVQVCLEFAAVLIENVLLLNVGNFKVFSCFEELFVD